MTHLPESDRLDDGRDDLPTKNHGMAYLGVALTVTPLVIAAIRVYVVANGHPTTIKVLVSTLDLRSLLLGTYLGVLPFLLLLALIAVALRTMRRSPSRSVARRRYIAVFAALPLVLLLAPIQDVAIIGSLLLLCVGLGAVAMIGGMAGGLVRLRRALKLRITNVRQSAVRGSSKHLETGLLRRLGSRITRRIVRDAARQALVVAEAILIAAIAIQAIFGRGMWVPTEALLLEGETGLSIGYVLEEEGGRMIFLEREDGSLHTILVDDVEARFICAEFATERELPIFAILFDIRTLAENNIPHCDSVAK